MNGFYSATAVFILPLDNNMVLMSFTLPTLSFLAFRLFFWPNEKKPTLNLISFERILSNVSISILSQHFHSSNEKKYSNEK